MAAGTVQVYDIAYQNLLGDTEHQWDSGNAGQFYWYLATSSYTPADTHETTSDVTNQVGGDGAPIAATDLVLQDGTTPGTMFFQAGAGASAGVVSFGDPVDITAKYLICVQPTTVNTPSATTDRLVFYVDLNSGGSDLVSTASEFTINMPSNGWFKMNQA